MDVTKAILVYLLVIKFYKGQSVVVNLSVAELSSIDLGLHESMNCVVNSTDSFLAIANFPWY